jgi:8-oxo-dGTP diphosphatase
VTHPIPVVAAVIRRREDGRVLISRRPAGTHLGGLWEFPGGKVEAGESPEAALMREVREEVHLDVTVRRLLSEAVHTYADRTVHLHFFDCTLENGHPFVRGETEFAWCTPAELRDYAMPDANASVVELLNSG